MKEILLGILGTFVTTAIPMLLAILRNRNATRKLGRKMSKILRKVGKRFEQQVELTWVDLGIGMREDNNPQAATKMKEMEKNIEDIRDSSPI